MSDDPHTALADSARVARVRAGLLGINAWAVLVALPLFYGGLHLGTLALASAPLVALALGLTLLPTRRAIGRGLLLAVYPPCLGLSIALSPQLVLRDAYGPIAMSLGAASLLFYVAGAASA